MRAKVLLFLKPPAFDNALVDLTVEADVAGVENDFTEKKVEADK